jgi:hypothetical protein
MNKELDVIMELMEDLQEKMQYGEGDFEERLGRKKPGIEVMKIEGKLPMGEDEAEGMESEMGEDELAMESDPMMGAELDEELEESPEEKLKKRIMKMRA